MTQITRIVDNYWQFQFQHTEINQSITKTNVKIQSQFVNFINLKVILSSKKGLSRFPLKSNKIKQKT